MGGFFGVASKTDCTLELFYGVDYHSHLGTRRGGMATFGKDGFQRAIHNIENSPFRTKFEKDVEELKGCFGIGLDIGLRTAAVADPVPSGQALQSRRSERLIICRSFCQKVYENGHTHFQEMSGGQINATELIASLICKKDSIVEGLQFVQQLDGWFHDAAVNDHRGAVCGERQIWSSTPLDSRQKRRTAYCVSFESFAYHQSGLYVIISELGPAEIVLYHTG